MLDPFSGSGVLCRAASDCGMEAIGYDLDPGEAPAEVLTLTALEAS